MNTNGLVLPKHMKGNIFILLFLNYLIQIQFNQESPGSNKEHFLSNIFKFVSRGNFLTSISKSNNKIQTTVASVTLDYDITFVLILNINFLNYCVP